jgi:hypothetical protein
MVVVSASGLETWNALATNEWHGSQQRMVFEAVFCIKEDAPPLPAMDVYI